MNNDTNTNTKKIEDETEPFTNQLNDGLYVGTDADGDRLYVDLFAREGTGSNYILTVGGMGMGKTYAVQSAAAEWVASGVDRSVVVVESLDQFAPVIEWFGGVRHRTVEDLPKTPEDVEHAHVNLGSPPYQDDAAVVEAVFEYLYAKARFHGLKETLVVVDDVDGLFSEYGLGQFCDLFDVLDRNEACAWLNTQHPGRLFGTPPSGLTDESAALVRRFGTIQAFRTVPQTRLLHQLGYTGEQCQAIRHLDRHQCIVRGLAEERDPKERSQRDTQAVTIETASEPAHSILTHTPSKHGEVTVYFERVTGGWS